jgi:hypothetical protein
MKVKHLPFFSLIMEKGAIMSNIHDLVEIKSPVGLSIEIDAGGIRRILIFSEDPDEQAQAHRLIASVASQMYLLDSALKSSNVQAEVSESSK